MDSDIIKTRPLRWGIIGTGRIAHAFAKALLAEQDAEIAGIAGRSREHTEEFAAWLQEMQEGISEHDANKASVANGNPKYDNLPSGSTHIHNVSAKKQHRDELAELLVYDTPAQLAAAPDIDIVYIATPNNTHAELSLLCLAFDKHVLCEKPFAMNTRQCAQVMELAQEKGLFCMEAMWTRFLPAIAKAKSLLQENKIGKLRYIRANFGGANPDFDAQSRYFSPALGGGSVMDVGIYPITFALTMMGRMPDEMRGFASVGSTGVDEVNDIEFLYHEPNAEGWNQDILCQLTSSVRFETGQDGIICGEYGKLYFPRCYAPDTFTMTRYLPIHPDTGAPISLEEAATAGITPAFHEVTEEFSFPFPCNGYEYEISEVTRCIRAGKTQSDLHPLSNTLAVMQLMDGLRRLWGVVYEEDQ